MNVLLIGNGAREHALAEAITRSHHQPRLFAFMKSHNPGIAGLCAAYCRGSHADVSAVCAKAREWGINMAVIGPEDPLSHGVVDALLSINVPAVGPPKSLSRLETSKSFTRSLVEKYAIPGNPRFQNFVSSAGLESFLQSLDGIVLKPDGLTGGKGVMVQGDHFTTREEALSLAKEILQKHGRLTVEEKMEGEEFSLQCFSDGKTVIPTPAVQDHKRRFIDDKGPNTGGMGSYSDHDHLLPFLKEKDIREGLEITQKVAAALFQETGELYKGIMYGGFMATPNGIKLLEYNARFGDPEAMNILPLLKTDFIDICQAIIDGALHEIKIEFEHQATVCKYIVPRGYGLPEDHPDSQSTSARIEIGDVGKTRLYYSSVDQKTDGLYMTTSRALGLVGIAGTLSEAEKIAEDAVSAISGPVDHRPDIGTAQLINRRIQNMKRLRG
jgi:phosphoribosylamine--glycine ligase